jgi:hypothetical protein
MGVLADSYRLSMIEVRVSKFNSMLIWYKNILSQACLGRHPPISVVIIVHDNFKFVVLCLTHAHVVMMLS